MFLSRIKLNLNNIDIKRNLGDCVVYHELVMEGFPHVDKKEARSVMGVLFRVEKDYLLIQSQERPDWSSLISKGYIVSADIKEFDLNFKNGELYIFKIKTCPSKTIDISPNSQKQKKDILKR